MKITDDVCKYAAERGLSEGEALQKGVEQKSKEFVGKGAEVYVASSPQTGLAVMACLQLFS